MNIIDRLALIKAGYSKKEIAEMEKAEKDEPKDTPQDDPKDTPQDDPKDTPQDEPKDTPDYKALYDEAIKNLEDANKKLKIAQSANNHANTADNDNVDESEYLKNLVMDFM